MNEIDPAADKLLRTAARQVMDSNATRSDAFLARFDAAFEKKLAEPAPARSAAIVDVSTNGRRSRGVIALWVAAAAALLVVITLPAIAMIPLGKVEFRSAAGSEDSLRRNSTIHAAKGNDTIFTLDDRRISVQLRGESTVTVASADTIRLNEGEIWTVVKSNSGYFAVETPNGKVVVHGTTFGVIVRNGETHVALEHGAVTFGRGDNTVAMTPGMVATLKNGELRPSVTVNDGELTPAWAKDLFDRAQASMFYPSVAPRQKGTK